MDKTIWENALYVGKHEVLATNILFGTVNLRYSWVLLYYRPVPDSVSCFSFENEKQKRDSYVKYKIIF